MLIARLFDMDANIIAVRQAASLVSRRFSLIRVMTLRDLSDRYAGQALGASWVVLSPVLLMTVYLLAFGLVFKGRIGTSDDGSGYTAFLLAGLVPWIAFQDCIARATTAVTSQANLVKQIVFPSEILPLRVALSSLPTLGVGLVVIIPVAIWSGHWSVFGLVFVLPVCVLCFILLLAGMTFWLAAVGVFLRDMKDIVAFLTGVGLFLHPVLYPPGAAPDWLSSLFALSPVSHMIWCFRDALVTPVPQPNVSWLIYPAFSLLAFTTGWRGFRMLKPSFGNVL